VQIGGTVKLLGVNRATPEVPLNVVFATGNTDPVPLLVILVTGWVVFVIVMFVVGIVIFVMGTVIFVIG